MLSACLRRQFFSSSSWYSSMISCPSEDPKVSPGSLILFLKMIIDSKISSTFYLLIIDSREQISFLFKVRQTIITNIHSVLKNFYRLRRRNIWEHWRSMWNCQLVRMLQCSSDKSFFTHWNHNDYTSRLHELLKICFGFWQFLLVILPLFFVLINQFQFLKKRENQLQIIIKLTTNSLFTSLIDFR